MKKIHSVLSLSSALVFAVFWSGCNNPVISAGKNDPNDKSNQPDLKRVEMGGSLARDLEIASINQTTVNEDLLKIQANVRNLKGADCRINYKIEWLNADGIVINDSSAVWLQLRIRGG
ncbi:MAG: YcfL family protein, partial [Verrucomicrobia bacterium]|nr:YcfL family protein [Verrucomicrobiota bacterium]